MKHLLFLSFLFTYTLCFSQSTASKNVSTFNIYSPELDTLKTIWVYLPENYEHTTIKYPVVYMHDAQNLFDAKTSFVGEWEVDETLDSLNLNVIIIGIEHGGKKRIDELTPFKHPKYKGGNGDAYLSFIVNTLKPHIDKTFRTKNNTTNTYIFGSSLGGLISFYAVLKYPEIFGKAGVFSPSFWFSDKIFEMAKDSKLNHKTLYIATGGKEGFNMVPDHKKMDSILQTKRHITLASFIRENEEHNEAFWRKEFKKAIVWLLQN